eukprot:657013-Amphidinium_carterae.1
MSTSSTASSTSSNSTTGESEDDAHASACVPDLQPGGQSDSSSSSSSDDKGKSSAVTLGVGRRRRVRDESFEWGCFKFTYKPGTTNSFQCTCPYHNAGAKTKCTKSA